MNWPAHPDLAQRRYRTRHLHAMVSGLVGQTSFGI
jgi:hypothetical protein